MSQLFSPSVFNPVLGVTGLVTAGAQARFYLTGTTTPAAVYADAELSTSLGSSVTADISGRLPAIYLNPEITYRARLYTAAGVQLPGADFDPVNDNTLGEFIEEVGGSTGSSLIGFLQSGSGATARTVQTKLREISISLADFGVTTASTPAQIVTAFTAAAKEAIATNRPLYVPPGIWPLDSTPGENPGVSSANPAFIVNGKTLMIFGDGEGVSVIRRADDTVTANQQCLLRAYGTNGAKAFIRDLTLDFNCDGQDDPPGADPLPVNFSWQHNECFEFRQPTNGTPGSWEAIDVRNVEIRDPISDGISLRGGINTSGWDVNRFVAIRVRNEKWALDEARPRVRGDITLTSIMGEVEVRDCRLPRYHLEFNEDLPPAPLVQVIREYDNEIGEYLTHNASYVTGYPRTDRKVYNSNVHWCFFTGYLNTVFYNCGIRLGRPLFRFTKGIHEFHGLRVILGDTYDATSIGATTLITTSVPQPGSIVIDGFSVEQEAGSVPPDFFIDGGQIFEYNKLVLQNGDMNASKMKLTLINNDTIVRNIRSTYDGTVTGTYGGAFVVGFASTAGRDFNITVEDNKLTNDAAMMFCGPGQSIAGGANQVQVSFAGNKCGAGKAVDLHSVGYGAAALTRLATPFTTAPASPSWTFSKFQHDELGEAKPATGDYVRSQQIKKITQAASTSPGWMTITSGAAASGNFVTLPALGT